MQLVEMKNVCYFPRYFFHRHPSIIPMFNHLQLRAVLLVLGCAIVIQGESNVGDNGNNDSVVIEALRKRLVAVSELLRYTRPLSASNTYKQQCSCEEYCTGRCFSMMCSPCDPAAFSFPGGEGLCLSVGPLGTGLLCHVDPLSGNLTDNACCSEAGPTCWLPQGSCCADGDCGTCPTNRYANNLTDLYPPLQRFFINGTCAAS
jgi:hypothetical protein